MKKILIALVLLIAFSCSEKSVQLPEIENAAITEITDVSPAYLFYDETQPDSLELNRANLIISTNWLVNVDKRLTLKQAIPAIKKLQDKKRNSSHKNENARNYYTCNDTSIKNLGFLDFTDVVYDFEGGKLEPENRISIAFIDLKRIIIYGLDGESTETNFSNFEIKLKGLYLISDNLIDVKLSFNQALTFQDYITFKSKLSKLKLENTVINNEEYIIN